MEHNSHAMSMGCAWWPASWVQWGSGESDFTVETWHMLPQAGAQGQHQQ